MGGVYYYYFYGFLGGGGFYLFIRFRRRGPPKDSLCGLRYSSVHHREGGVSRSDLRGAQGQVVHTWPQRGYVWPTFTREIRPDGSTVLRSLVGENGKTGKQYNRKNSKKKTVEEKLEKWQLAVKSQ